MKFIFIKNKHWFFSLVSAALLIFFWIDVDRINTQKIQQEVGKQTIPQQSKSLGYRDGSFSASSPTPWGAVAILVSINNGKWTDIRYTTFPSSPPSQYAADILVAQALEAQSANIHGVSGATYTSRAMQADLRTIIMQTKQ